MKDFFKYLTSGAGDKQWGIFLTVVGKYTSPPYAMYPSKDHPSGYYFDWESGRVLDEFQLNYITEGHGILQTNESEYRITPGSLILIKPGTKHRYRPDITSGWTEYFMGFNGKIAEHFIQQTFEDPGGPVISCGYQVEIVDSYQKIFDLARSQKPAYHQIASGMILKTLGYVSAYMKTQHLTEPNVDLLVNEAKNYLWETVDTVADLQAFCKKNHISYSYFRKIFKLYTGIAPHQFYLDLKIMRSKEMIVSTDKTIKEITYELGFESIHYFSRLFKKKTGLSPSELRKPEKRN